MNETLDWTRLSSDSTLNTKRIQYDSNKQSFTRIAFDVYQLNSSPIEALWILERDENGEQYLVATYDDPTLESTGNWKALSNKSASSTTLYYKNAALCSVIPADFGVMADDISVFERVLVNKVSNDRSFMKKVIESQTREKQDIILQQFPELA